MNFNQDLSGKTALVTGGAGFVGSHLVDRLLADGLHVIALDNFITGHARNIAHLEGNPAFRFIQHDVSEPFDVEGPVDFVFHFASPASPIDYVQIPIETLKAGSYASHNSLDLALRKKATYLVASTSEVYGDPEIHPQPESYWGNVNSIGIRSCYDEAKRYAEAAAMAYHRAHGVDTRIVRIFNTYGPRMRLDDGRVVPAFIGQALRGEPMTIFGDGTQTRSFCYVSDLVEGIWRLARSQLPRAGELRQSPRNEHAPVCGSHRRRLRHRAPRRPQAAAARRPESPQARHHPRQGSPRLGTGRPLRPRHPRDRRILPRPASTRVILVA
jgi:dTDP-glucose 4,6-dehydratase